MAKQKWTDERVQEVRDLKAQGLRPVDIQKKLGLTQSSVHYALNVYKMSGESIGEDDDIPKEKPRHKNSLLNWGSARVRSVFGK